MPRQTLDVMEVELAGFVALLEPQSNFLSGKLIKEQLHGHVEGGLPLSILVGVVQLVQNPRANKPVDGEGSLGPIYCDDVLGV